MGARVHRFPLAGLLAGLLALLLTACATPPFRDEVMRSADRQLTPAVASSQAEGVAGRRVLWGGRIAEVRNLADRTEITAVAYPLDGSGVPETGKRSLGRFILVRAGYLESADYAPGRDITAYGEITGLRSVKVGNASLLVPVVKGLELRLWPKAPARSEPSVHFGIGVGVGL